MIHVKKSNIGFGYCISFCGKEVDEFKASISPKTNTCKECLIAYRERENKKQKENLVNHCVMTIGCAANHEKVASHMYDIVVESYDLEPKK